MVPISLRPFSGIPDDVFCDHVSRWRTHAPLTISITWDRAREAAETLKTIASNGVAVRDLGLLSYVQGKFPGFFQGQMGKKRGATFALSNLGVLPKSMREHSDGWTIGKTAFCSTDVVAGPTCNFDVIGHGDGGITVAVTRDERGLDGEVVGRLVEEFRRNLEGVIEQSER